MFKLYYHFARRQRDCRCLYSVKTDTFYVEPFDYIDINRFYNVQVIFKAKHYLHLLIQHHEIPKRYYKCKERKKE